jgi:hypothetical protein
MTCTEARGALMGMSMGSSPGAADGMPLCRLFWFQRLSRRYGRGFQVVLTHTAP